MKTHNIELWAALLVILLISGVYWLGVAQLNLSPDAGSALSLGLGVIGFGLMLMTETLYSMRKRYRRARWGRMAHWLRFHIFTGLVGGHTWCFSIPTGNLTASPG